MAISLLFLLLARDIPPLERETAKSGPFDTLDMYTLTDTVTPTEACSQGGVPGWV